MDKRWRIEIHSLLLVVAGFPSLIVTLLINIAVASSCSPVREAAAATVPSLRSNLVRWCGILKFRQET